MKFYTILILCLFIVGCTNYQVSPGKGVPTKEFSSAQLESANIVLDKGIIINDPEHDWLKVPEGTKQWDKPDNSNPYPWPFTDLKSIQVGVDDKYIYIKYSFWGNFPDKTPEYTGDIIESTGAKAEINGKDVLTEAISYAYNNKKLNMPIIGLNSMINPIGKDETSETIYSTMTGEGLVSKGKDYLIGAFPLKLANLTNGQEVNIEFSVESGSLKYHHESIDLIQEKGKSSSLVHYKIGDNTYTVIANPNYVDELPSKDKLLK